MGELPVGSAVTLSGRVSAARELSAPGPARSPFTAVQLAQLDEALTLASRSTGLSFSIYLGVMAEPTRTHAEQLHATMPDPSSAVVIAVSPNQRVVEVVTGAESARRLPNHTCRLAVMAMVASFKEGDLAGGLVSGLRMLSDQAGPAHA
jgi:hypothetical protein